MEINLAIIDFNPGQGGGVKPSGTLDISENGVYNVYTYASASVDVHPSISLSETYISNGSYNITGEFNGGVITVDVPAPQFVTETLNVSANGTYNPGQGVDGYSQVVVDVPQSVIGYTQKEITEGVQIVNLSNSASYVHPFAFEKDSYLQTVNLPNCTSVEENAFENCSNLKTVSLPECKTIGSSAFEYCFSLSEISLPMCSYINDNAFFNCFSLLQISLPMCSYIDGAVFRLCSSLSQISLPVCSYIGRGTFQDCTSLSEISLPMCSYIFLNAFLNCSSLSIITIGYSGVCSLPYNAFNGTPIASGTGSIYVPVSLVDSYKSAINWSVYSSQIFPIE